VSRARHGFVLVAALLAMVLIAALTAGVLFATTEATRAGTAGVTRERALIASESALVTAITGGEIQLPSPIGVGGTSSYLIDSDEWQVVVYTTRLDSTIYWIVADAKGLSSGIGARRRIGVFVRAAHHDDDSITIDPVSELAWEELF
jgi:hypothetical protein